VTYGRKKFYNIDTSWPLLVTEDGYGYCGFYFENTTLRSSWEDRLPQKIVLDAGGAEEDPKYQVMLGTLNQLEGTVQLTSLY
jgi:hypothetical protein